jgi:hypothetical protein
MNDDKRAAPTASFAAGCGFLSTGELQSAIAGRLSQERQAEFDRHIESGCSECVTLAADLETFRRVVSGGVLDSERREEDQLSEPLRSLLRREIRRRNLTPS